MVGNPPINKKDSQIFPKILGQRRPTSNNNTTSNPFCNSVRAENSGFAETDLLPRKATNTKVLPDEILSSSAKVVLAP